MKINIIDYVCNSGGAELYIKELIKAILRVKKETSINLISYGSAYEIYKNFVEKEKLNISVFNLKPNNIERTVKKRIFNIPGTSKINQYFGIGSDWHIEVDISMFHKTDVIIFPWIHKHRLIGNTKAKILATMHDCILFDIPGLISKFEVKEEKKSYESFQKQENIKIVSISNATTSSIIKHFKTNKKKIFLIPNGTDHISNHHHNDGNVIEDYYLYPANTFPHKNHEFLFKAFNKSNSKKKLLLTGKGTDFLKKFDRRSIKLKKVLNNLSSINKNNVIGLGYLDNNTYMNVLKNCTAVIFPSRAEGFGFPIIEALFLKKPLLCSDLPVIKETVKLVGGNAIWFDNGKVDKLSDTIRNFEAEYTKHKVFFNKNFQNLKHIKWDNVAKSYINLVC